MSSTSLLSEPTHLFAPLIFSLTHTHLPLDSLSYLSIANATSDLLLLALHVLLAPPPPAFDALPTYAFARDTRMLSLFKESYARIPKLGTKPPRLRRLAETLMDVIGETREGFRTRVKRLGRLIDGEGGMK